jgi:phage tail-like protein
VRGLVEGLANPHPIGATLPGVYQEDSFGQRLCLVIDDLLAPIVASLDGFPAYLDPRTTASDLLGWLAGWVGVVIDTDQDPERQRDAVRSGVALHERRGTQQGLRDAVRAWFEVEPEIIETGGTAWSSVPGGELPGSPDPHLLVRLRVPDLATVDPAYLDTLVSTLKPAHVPHHVEILLGDPAP